MIPPTDAVAGERVLEPCLRDGAPGDWWAARHASCTGSEHVAAGLVVRCACGCHIIKGTVGAPARGPKDGAP